MEGEQERYIIYCPGCGSQLEDIQPLEGDTLPLDDGPRTIYDCYCERCGWSGDISPDKEEFHRREVYR